MPFTQQTFMDLESSRDQNTVVLNIKLQYVKQDCLGSDTLKLSSLARLNPLECARFSAHLKIARSQTEV